MRSLILLLLGVVVAGCDDGSGPSRPTVELSAARTWGLPVPLSFIGRAPQLTIAGTIDVNEPCYDFSASLEGARDTLVVRLHANRREGHCQQELARFAYRLTISGLKGGVQPLRVVYDHTGPPTFVEVAFEGAVDIQ
jgi:hypothetical protein